MLDYWACEISVTGGSTPGLYESSGILQYSDWEEYQLQGGRGAEPGFTVDSQTFAINLKSGGTRDADEPGRSRVWLRPTSPTTPTATPPSRCSTTTDTDGTQSATWFATPGEQVGPLTVYFRLGSRRRPSCSTTGRSSWRFRTASKPGVYQSGAPGRANWKECQLQNADAGQHLNFTVDTKTFSINLPSGGCQTAMTG